MQNSDDTITRCLMKFEPTDTQRLYVGIYYAVITVIGVILNILLLLVYCIIWQHIKRSIIYTMTLSLTVSSLVNITVNLYCMIPCTFTLCKFYSTDTLMIIAAILETLGYYTTIATNCIISLERLSLFFCKTVNNFISKNNILLILLPWIWGTVVTATTTAMGCYKRFNRWTLQYTFECGSCDIVRHFNLTQVLFICLQVVVLVMLCGYVSIILQTCFGMSIVPVRKSVQSKNVPLIFQCFAICTLQWLSATVFFIGGVLWGYNIPSAMVGNTFIVGNASINAVVSLLFNKTIRRGLVCLFRCKKRHRSIIDIAAVTRIQPHYTQKNPSSYNYKRNNGNIGSDP